MKGRFTRWKQTTRSFFNQKHMGKPILRIEKTNDQVKLVAQGDLTVQHAKELHSFLLQNSDHQSEIHLIMTEAASLDIAGIQLAYAWKSDLYKQGRKAIVTLPDRNDLFDLLEKSGINKIF